MPNPNDFMDAVQAPATTSRSGLTVGLSPQQRLEVAMRRANAADPSDIPDPVGYDTPINLGVPNPHGRGLDAFEPNNIIFDAYSQAKGEYDAGQLPSPGADTALVGGSPLIDGSGKVATMIRNAMSLATRRVPYVWGGTTANGVDCSGLIYYAAKSAGLDVQRWRAVDYGRMGQAVTMDQARPGDIVYYDEPGNTDHVGIYIGNGQMIQAPQSGDVVKVSRVGKATSIRRIFDDSAFGSIATAAGSTVTAYGGRPFTPTVGSYQPGLAGAFNTAAALGSTLPRVNPAPAVHGVPK